MKETAVDYLFSKLWEAGHAKFEWQIILIEANKKHKKEIMHAFKAGAFYPGHELEAEQYYFEKYENETNK